MGIVLGITFPIYAAVGLGYWIVWKGAFSSTEMRSIGRYVLNIALPALAFSAVASSDPVEVFQPGYVLIFATAGLANIAVSYLLFSLRGVDPRRRALGVMGSSCPNSGFVGYPIMLLAFPDQAGVILALNFLTENLLLVPTCLILMEFAAGNRDQPLLVRIGKILWAIAKMPLLIAMGLGLLVTFLQVPVPAPLMRFVDMLAASAGALALIVVGGSLVGLPRHGNKGLALQISASKLLLHPALVAVIAAGVLATGLVELSPAMHSAVILSAAMPMFTMYTVLAQRQGLEGAASLALLGTTVCAFFTLNLFLVWLT